jgi:hypothetical protein
MMKNLIIIIGLIFCLNAKSENSFSNLNKEKNHTINLFLNSSIKNKDKNNNGVIFVSSILVGVNLGYFILHKTNPKFEYNQKTQSFEKEFRVPWGFNIVGVSGLCLVLTYNFYF